MMNLFLGFLFGILGGLITIAATIPWVITGDKATAFTLLVVVAAVGGFACAHFTNSVRARLGYCIGIFAIFFAIVGANPGKTAAATAFIAITFFSLGRLIWNAIRN